MRPVFYVFWTVMGVVLCGSGYPLESPCIRIEGLYEYKLLDQDEVPESSAAYNFVVTLCGCSWVISYEDITAAINANVVGVRVTASSDGTNVYVVRQYSEQALTQLWGERYQTNKEGWATNVAEIYPGAYPPYQECVVQGLWLAFCSRCVLPPTKGRAKPREWVDLEIFYRNTNFLCEYEWTEDPKLGPRQIAFRNPGWEVGRDPKTGRAWRMRLAPPYDKGYIEAVGFWKRSTNINGVVLPLELEFTSFSPIHDKGSKSGFRKRTVETFYVTNVQCVPMEQIPPPLPGRAMITDRRFMDIGYGRIVYATNRWLLTNDSFLAFRRKNTTQIPLEQEVLIELGIQPPKGVWKKYAIWGLLVLPLGLVALKALADKLTKKSKTTAT